MRALDTEAILEFPLTGLQLIEAGAGTGKTYTISNLYLRHVLAGRDVGEILVVTFTNAATDELRGRIRARLYQALQIAGYVEDEHTGSLLRPLLETPDEDSLWELLAQGYLPEVFGKDSANMEPFLANALKTLAKDEFMRRLFRRLVAGNTRVRDRLTLAVRSMEQAAIHTIHGFCQRSLCDFAFLSGQPFEAEMGEDDELRLQAIADWWRQALYPLDRGEVEVVLQVLGGYSGLAGKLTPLLNPAPKKWLPDPPDRDEIEGKRESLKEAIEQLRPVWHKIAGEIHDILLHNDRLSRARGKGYQHEELNLSLEELAGFFTGDQGGYLPPSFKILTREYIQQNLKKTGRDDSPDHPFFHACQHVQTQFDAYCMALKSHLLAAASQIVRTQLAERKRQQQLVTYDDLLTGLHAALDGDNALELAEHLRKRYPVALIDEFQDTDSIQYEIFRQLYHQASATTLVMIGDPKQAIYSFRGGDIFTYLRARRDVGDTNLWTLDTNWRSTPQVIEVVNLIFSRNDPFVFPEIPYRKAVPAAKEHTSLTRAGKTVPALTLWTLPLGERNGEPKAMGVEDARKITHAAVAYEIAHLLQEAGEGTARLGDRTVQPGDIAVLVRNGFEAVNLKQALKRRGINSVAVLRDRIWDTVEAEALLTLLESVASPEDRGLARRALAARVLELTAAELHQRLEDDRGWIEWVDHLMSVRELWLGRGFMAAFQHLLRGFDLVAALGRSGEGERRLTNLLHLAELLQQASRTHPGIDALIVWFRHQREVGAGKTTELRLESDEALVKIVTIHASKGLEYPIVFVPYLWACQPRDKDKNSLLQWHQDGQACVTGDWQEGDDAFLAAEKERLAEDVRLAYVALTRARSALWLVWGGAGSKPGHAGQTALAWLLHPDQTPEDLRVLRPQVFDGHSPPSHHQVRQRFKHANPDILRVEPLPEVDAGPATTPAEDLPELKRAEFTGTIATDWRIQSYSTLTRDLHQVSTVTGRPGPDTPFPFRFPAGPQVGSFLHLLLEKLVFHANVSSQVEQLAPVIAPRFSLDVGEDLDSLGRWMEEVVHTPLDGTDLQLGALDPARQLRELSFDFATAQVDPAALDALLRDSTGNQDLPRLTGARFRGLVTGVIDLVFESGGRFYLADYKSNLLGRTGRDYTSPKLEEQIRLRRYDIQYLLYSIALHRYLRQRLAGYDYERHFGGVFYLFLRGMTACTGPGQGIWFHRPDAELIRQLDEEIFTHREETA